MARIFPSRWLYAADRSAGREAERQVYEALARLPQEFAVYHGVQFSVVCRGGRREDVEIDFLVTHDDYGVLVLEVKAGAIEFRDRCWTQAIGAGARTAIDDPVTQLRDHKHALKDYLASDRRWQGPLFVPASGHVFPDTAADWPEDVADAPGAMVATSRSLADVEAWVRRCLAHHWGTERPAQGRLVAQLVHAKCNPIIGTQRPFTGIGGTIASAQQQIEEATQRQLGALSILRRRTRVLITGPAGSGKTLLAMKRAREVVSEVRGRVLYTCFNTKLRDHVASVLQGEPGITVLTFHQLLKELVRAAGLPWQPPEGASREDQDRWWREEAPRLALDALPKATHLRFDAILVDEGQDFQADWWVLVELLLTRPEASFLWVFADDNQRIYQRASVAANLADEFPLIHNLRNTQRIHELFKHLYVGEQAAALGPLGEPVVWIDEAEHGGSMFAALDAHVGQLLAEGVRPEDIVVLTSRGVRTTDLCFGGRVGGVELAERLAVPTPGRVGWDTVRRFKGLESRVVILVELQDLLEHEELQYVGLSRATTLLTVIGTAPQLRRLRKR